MITHEELVDVCQEIGTVAESNFVFTFGLTDRLDGKTFDTLTVAELLTHINQRRVNYNQAYGNEVTL